MTGAGTCMYLRICCKTNERYNFIFFLFELFNGDIVTVDVVTRLFGFDLALSFSLFFINNDYEQGEQFYMNAIDIVSIFGAFNFSFFFATFYVRSQKCILLLIDSYVRLGLLLLLPSWYGCVAGTCHTVYRFSLLMWRNHRLYLYTIKNCTPYETNEAENTKMKRAQTNWWNANANDGEREKNAE